MGYPLIPPKYQFSDSSGAPLSGGLVYVYDAGTSTEATTYTTADLSTANDNPIILDARGEAPTGIYLADDSQYKFVLNDANGATVWEQDNYRSPTRAHAYSDTAQTLTDNGVIDTNVAVTWIVTTMIASATLPDGTEGKRKFLVMKTDGGACTVTPSSFANGTTIVFDDVGDSADLIFINSSWHWLGGTAKIAASGVNAYGDTVQTLTGPGAVSITASITHLVTTGDDQLTLADGVHGQRKFIVMKTDGGDGVLSPSSFGNCASILFDDVHDSADLLFTNGVWNFMGGTATSSFGHLRQVPPGALALAGLTPTITVTS